MASSFIKALPGSALSWSESLRCTLFSFWLGFIGASVFFWGRSHIFPKSWRAWSKRCGLGSHRSSDSDGKAWNNSRYNRDVEKPRGSFDMRSFKTSLRHCVNDPGICGPGTLSWTPVEVRSSNFLLPMCWGEKAFAAKQQSTMRSWSQAGRRRQYRTSLKKTVGSPSPSFFSLLRWYHDQRRSIYVSGREIIILTRSISVRVFLCLYNHVHHNI